MSISLFFLAPVFSTSIRLEKSLRWMLFLPFILNIIAFVVYSTLFGIDRSYRFEVASITINFLFLIVIGILFCIFFKRKLITN
jgi:predicted cobalt transporter CbtA